MSGRFLDKKELIAEEKEFVERNHGVSLGKYICAYIVALIIIIASFLQASVSLQIASVIFSLLGLGVITYIFIRKDREIITAMELQNAIFAGAAKVATEFCMILKYNGDVIYTDPEYHKKFSQLKNRGLEGLDALCESGGIDREDKERLLLALSEGRAESVPFALSDSEQGERTVPLTLEPIGFYFKRDQKLSLASGSTKRPSGYFLLRAQKEDGVQQYNDYLNEFSIGFYALKEDGKFLIVNDSFSGAIGYETEELLKKQITFEELVFNQRDYQRIISEQGVWNGEIVLKNKNNDPVRVLMSQFSVVDETGEVTGKRGVVMKLSLDGSEGEYKEEAEQRIPDLLRNSPIATAMLDMKGDIARSNKAFREITARRENTDRKWNLLDVISDEAKQEVKELLENAIAGEESVGRPVDVKMKGDGETMASLYINKATNKSGEFKGLICHLIDTTELKNLELRFVHSQKMQAVGQLAGGIAHDFNNLLTAMMGFCDLLLMRHPAGDQSFADIMQIKQNANRAANLVRQLLAFSRKQTLQPEVINITNVFADLSNLIGRLIGENIELKMVHGKDLWRVRVDQGQLEQVIINLAVNARDAMQDGGTLTIATKNVTIEGNKSLDKNMIPPAEDEVIEGGDYIQVEVSDTGCGMDSELVGKIFEPFFSTKAIGSGTGLGLSTVYGIIKQTDGYVYVSSKPKKGTKFTIFLKRYEATEKEEKEAFEPTIAVATADLTGDGTILLVEDEAPVRMFSVSALKNKGYRVLEADSGEAALDVIKEKGDEIDVIITDVVMPGINGPAMIEQVYKKYPDVKVIFMSGYAEDAFVSTYGEDRKFNFLSKPYTLKQLATKVKEVMKEEG